MRIDLKVELKVEDKEFKMNHSTIQHIETNGYQVKSLFEMLKDGTREMHREIDLALPVMKQDLTLDQYGAHLLNLLGFYIPLEEHIMSFMSEMHNWASFEMHRRLKSQLLISDLIALGEMPTTLTQIPLCHEIRKINTVAELAGVLYVIEGLTLTSQITQRKLKAQLLLDEKQIRYYTGYAGNTFEIWNKLRFQAENIVADYEKSDAVRSARYTFVSLMNWLKS